MNPTDVNHRILPTILSSWRIKMSVSIHDIDYSSDYDASGWENEVVYLKPHASWMKPFGKMAVLTNVCMTVPEEKQADAHGVVTALTDDQETVISSLFPHNPSQVMRLVWNSGQELYLRNTGTFSVTLNLLLRD